MRATLYDNDEANALQDRVESNDYNTECRQSIEDEQTFDVAATKTDAADGGQTYSSGSGGGGSSNNKAAWWVWFIVIIIAILVGATCGFAFAIYKAKRDAARGSQQSYAAMTDVKY